MSLRPCSMLCPQNSVCRVPRVLIRTPKLYHYGAYPNLSISCVHPLLAYPIRLVKPHCAGLYNVPNTLAFSFRLQLTNSFAFRRAGGATRIWHVTAVCPPSRPARLSGAGGTFRGVSATLKRASNVTIKWPNLPSTAAPPLFRRFSYPPTETPKTQTTLCLLAVTRCRLLQTFTRNMFTFRSFVSVCQS